MSEQKFDHMIRTMAGKGLRITEQRKTLARLFAAATGYITAKEVYEELEAKHSGLSFDTVYRNLRVLEELGVLEQFYFEAGSKFRIGCFSHGHKHHHHLICISCDRVQPFEYCPMPYVTGFPESFHIVKHKFEIYGYCGQCLGEKGNMSPNSLSHIELSPNAS